MSTVVNQDELNAAYAAARAAINPVYSHMISDEMLQSIIAPAYRAGINARFAAHVIPSKGK